MIFYRAVDSEGRLHLTGTQAEAKKINKQFDEFDCPTSKPELMAILQDLLDRAQAPTAEAIVAAEDPKPEPVTKTEPRIVTDPDDVMAFILDEATTAQIENIFSALGTRFSELNKSQSS